MNAGRILGALGRIVVAVVGLALLAAGIDGIVYWAGVDLADRWSLYLDRAWLYSAPARGWWPWPVGLAGCAGLIAGFWILVAHLRPRSCADAPLGTADQGSLAVRPAAIGEAIADELAASADVRDSRARARAIHGDAMVTVELRAAPGTDLDALRRSLSDSSAVLAESLGEHALPTRYIIRLDKPGA